MTWLLEEPWAILLMGAALVAMLLVVLVQTRHWAALVAVATAVILTIALLVVEHYVVTPTEEIQTVIYGVAAALEANDQPAVLARISASAEGLRSVVEGNMPRVDFSKARIIGRMSVVINKLTSPQSALASFQGLINGRAGGNRQNVTRLGRFTVKLRREGDRWLVSGYEEDR